LTRSESDNSPPSISEMNERLIASVKATSELKQIEAPVPLDVVGREANHVEVARIERLTPAARTTRLSK